tara:strand:- start:5671 stop:8514 length:2844 start_codon:yes stop_codon:yes gene_type:complete
MVTFATPNGGNSASTGHQNSNNNASANAQTSNYSSGGGHPSAGGYATYTAAAVKAAPTPKTPTYASPHEQGQNNTKTTTTKAANTTTNNTTNNNYIENAYEDDWIKTWADTFAATSDLNLSSLNTSFLDSSQRNADNINSNYQLIGDNENSIVGNMKSTGLQIDGIENDYSNLFSDVGTNEESIDSTNKDVDGLNTNLSNLGESLRGDLAGLSKVQKDYGLKLTDQDGNIVDLEKDIIANEQSQQQGQRADQTARNAQDTAINKALDDVDYQFGDVTKAQAELKQGTAYSFSLADDAIENLNTDLGDLGLDMDNVTFGLGEDITGNAEAITANTEYTKNTNAALLKAEEAISLATDGKIKTVNEYIKAVRDGSADADEAIDALIDDYNEAYLLSDITLQQNINDQGQMWGAELLGNRKEIDSNLGNALVTVNSDMETYASDASTSRDQLKKAITLYTDGKFTTISDYVSAVEKGEAEVNDHIVRLMEAYDAAQTKSLETSDTTQGKVDQSILDKMDQYNTSQTRSLEASDTNQGKVDQSILDKMDQYNAAQSNALSQSVNFTDQQIKGLERDVVLTASDASTARDQLKESIIKFTNGKFTTISDYVSAVERGEAEVNDEIIGLMEAYDAAQTKSLETSNAANKSANDAQDDNFSEKDKYDQKYWSNRLKELKESGLSESDVQSQLRKEMSILKDKTYSGDTIVTGEDHITAWADFNSFMYSLGITDAGPNAPKEYVYETFLNNIDQWVKDGKVTVESSTSGMFDENTTNIYTLPNGQQVITKGTSPMFTDENGEEFRFGNDTLTLFMDGVELGSRDGGVTTVTKQGEANHVDSTVNIGDDTNPNSAGNQTSGNDNSTPEPEVVEEVVEEEETDPVVGEDIPLPDNLTDPDGDGAYGQDGRAFTLDGVTYWKRIKDRNGRWTYTRLDSYQINGTGSRRSSWGENVQNF